MASTYKLTTVLGVKDRMTVALKQANARMSAFFNNAKKKTSSFERAIANADKRSRRAFRGMSGVLTGVLGAQVVSRALAGVKNQLMGIVSEAAKMQDMRASFTPLLGSAAKAESLMAQLAETAASTPFRINDIAKSAQTLIGFGAATEENVVSVFRMLGDTAQGNAQKLDSVTRAFGKIQARGKASMEELNMLIDAGVPITGQLAEMLGVTNAELFDMVSKGEVTGEVITAAFKKMTSQGGIFFMGMKIASETFNGQLSTLRDNFSLLQAAIGTALLPVLQKMIVRTTGIVSKVREWASSNQDIIAAKVEAFVKNTVTALQAMWAILKPVLSTIVNLVKIMVKWKDILMIAGAAIIGYKAAMIAMRAPLLFFTTAQKLATVAQVALNVAMSANPIGLIIAGVAALTTGIILLVKNWASLTEWVQNSNNWFAKTARAVTAFAVKFAKLTPIFHMIKIGIQQFKILWDGFKEAFQSGSFIEGIMKVGKALMDALLTPFLYIKDLVADSAIFGFLKKITGSFFGASEDGFSEPKSTPPTGRLSSFPSPQLATPQSISTTNITEQRGIVDVNFNNTPENAQVASSGAAIGAMATVNVGRAR